VGVRACPIIGFHLADEIRRGAIAVKGDIGAFTADGMTFADGTSDEFDEVIFATGFRAALGMFGGRDPAGSLRIRPPAKACREHGSARPVFRRPQPRRARGIFMIGRDARRVAQMIQQSGVA
jgi:hypothetical protein